jgi:hypothetical protein
MLKNETTKICINADCQKNIEKEAKFCPYCANSQDPTASGQASPLNGQAGSAAQPIARPYSPEPKGSTSTPQNASAGRAFLLRASEQIWHFEEEEISVGPGDRRPLLVIDEQIVHLSQTTKLLTAEELLRRVRHLVEQLDVPVDVNLETAYWQRDTRQGRDRIITSLQRGHGYQDIKIILGVDYLGKWASIHMDIAVEADPFPVPPKEPEIEFMPNITAIVFIFISGLVAVISYMTGSNPQNFYQSSMYFGVTILATIIFIASVIWLNTSNSAQRVRIRNEQMALRARREQAEQRRAEHKANERLSRTFRTDDIRLFASAMKSVFQFVVDDIVEGGAKVVRVEGGKGGFFSHSGVTVAEPAPRASNASEMEV